MRTLLALALLLAQTLPSQPDFSGRWVLVSPAPGTATARLLVVQQPVTRTNVRGEPMRPAFLRVSIRREADSGISDDSYDIGIVGGMVGGLGKNGLIENPRPASHHSTLWIGRTLQFWAETYVGESPRDGQWTERREVWSLDADGRLRIEITTEAWNRPRQRQVRFYRRLGGGSWKLAARSWKLRGAAKPRLLDARDQRPDLRDIHLLNRHRLQIRLREERGQVEVGFEPDMDRGR